MALFNYATKEITLKIVYYGPGLSGKTTNLQYLHSVLNADTKGKLLSLSTESDRTLFFDFLPVELGKIREFSIRFQLYTVPGQIRYNATRKVVLKGADAVVFVADSQREMRDQNIESFVNMRENLLSNNINPDEIPVILQYNKRDLKNISSIEELNSALNSRSYDVIEAVAIKGAGVEDSFRLITKLILRHISRKHKIEIQPLQNREDIIQPATPGETREIAPQITEPVIAKKSAVHAELVPEYETKQKIPVPEPVIPERSAGHAELVPEYEPKQKISLPEPVIPEKSAVHAKSVPDFELNKTPLKTDQKAVKKVTEEELWSVPAAEKVVVTETCNYTPAAMEKINMINEEIKKIHAVLSDLQATVAGLSKGTRELPALKRGQEESNAILREIIAIINNLKTKKSWFKF